MKTWKKLLALLLALAMVFAFAACGGNNDDDDDDDDDKKGSSSVEGTKPKNPESETTKPEVTEPEVTEPEAYGDWAMEIDVIDYMNLSVIGDVGGLVELPDMPVILVMGLEIDADGDFEMTFELDEDDVLEYYDAATQTVADYLVATYEAQGVSQADLEALLEMSAYDYSASFVYDYFVTVEETIYAMNTSGYCKLDGDKLYIGADKEEIEDPTDYFVLSAEGDELTVTELGGEGADMIVAAIETMGAELPWVFERQ